MGGVKSESAAPGKENARERRRRMRKDNAILRESQALELFAGGMAYDEIAAQMKVASSTAWELVKRGLTRRAETEGATVAEARALYVGRLELMLGAWLPRALGKGLDADLQPMPPNEPAAKVVLGILDRMADVLGIKAPQKLDVDLHDSRPPDAARLTVDIMDALRRTAEKERTIDGHLAEAGTNMEHATRGNDRQAPPQIEPKKKREAKS